MRTLSKSQMNALKRVCAKDESRPVYESILHEEGNMIATDGHTLVVIAVDYDESLEGKLIHSKDGREIEGRYVNYKAVIPSRDDTTYIDVDAEKLYKGVKALSKLKIKFSEPQIEVNGVFYQANRMLKALDVIGSHKDLKFRRDESRGHGAMMIIEADGFEALVMPMLPPKDVDGFNEEAIKSNGYKRIYSMDEAIEFKVRDKMPIAFRGSISEGEVMGTFTKYDREYTIVGTKYFTHAVLNGVHQEAIPFTYTKFDELIERTPREIATVDFEVPESMKMDVILHDKDGNITKRKMSIYRIEKVRGIEIVTVSSKPFDLRVYNGHVVASATNSIESMEKIENLKEMLEEHIEREYK